MDSKKIIRLCQALKLEGGPSSTVRMDKEMSMAKKWNTDLCLVGKVISNKGTNREALRRVLPLIWRALHGVEIESFGKENIFLAQFKIV